MVGLLGMLGAGAAMGARDASNATVKAMNEMEVRQGQNDMEMNREQLRQQYLDRRYGQQRQDNFDMAKNKAILDERNYQRNRDNKLSDDEINHSRRMEIENKKESGRNSRNSDRIAAMKSSSGSNSGGGKGQNSVTLEDGTEFIPNDADSKNAANLKALGLVPTIQKGYEMIYARGLASQAAGSVAGLRHGAIPEAMNMSNQLLGGNSSNIQQEQKGRLQYNPKTGGF